MEQILKLENGNVFGLKILIFKTFGLQIRKNIAAKQLLDIIETMI